MKNNYKIKRKRKRKKLEFKRRVKKRIKNTYIKLLILLALFIIIIIMNGKIFISTKPKPKYFTCLASMVKLENRYIRESVEHYLKLGVDKFYFAEDNEPDGERIADVLQDYIDKGIVVVINAIGAKWDPIDFYELALRRLNNVCEWMIYFDIDEFLEFRNKSMTIKDYLTLDGFDKCEVIKIHWLVYCDNDLVHYDNRPLEERFTKPDYNNNGNKFHKSIVRVKDYNITMFDSTGHQPNETYTYSCDAAGRYYKLPINILGSPNYKYCYLKHYNMKTAEEFLMKILRGQKGNKPYDYDQKIQKIDKFFSCNKVTEEKLKIFENALNMTFPKYHNRANEDNK